MRVSIKSADGTSLMSCTVFSVPEAALWAWDRMSKMIEDLEAPVELYAEVWQLASVTNFDEPKSSEEEVEEEFEPRRRRRSCLSEMIKNAQRMEIFRTRTRWTTVTMDCPCCGMPGTSVNVGQVRLEDPFLLTTLTEPLAQLSVRHVKPVVTGQLLSPWTCDVCSEPVDLNDFDSDYEECVHD